MSFVKIKSVLINTEHVRSVFIQDAGEMALVFYYVNSEGYDSIPMDDMAEAEAFRWQFQNEANCP